MQIERLAVGEGFNPEIGFVRRRDITSSHAQFRFSPRPSKRFTAVRKFTYSGFFKQLEDGSGRRVWRDAEAEHNIEFHNGDRFLVNAMRFYEYLPVAFPIAAGVTLPVGGYDFSNVKVGYNLGPKRRISGSFSVERGTFYNGHKTSVTLSRGRTKFSTRLSAEPTYALNKVELLQGSFTNHLLGTRATYSIAPLMFVSALIQYNSARKALSSNVRLRWEYRSGSELFVVYNEERDTRPSGFPMMKNKALIVKTNRLFRF